MRTPSPPSEQTMLLQLATIASIPEKRHSDFYKLVLAPHRYRWEMDEKRRAGSEFARKGSLAKAAKAMRIVRGALFNELSDSEHDRLNLALRALGLDRESQVAEDDFHSYYQSTFASDSTECAFVALNLASALDWATGAPPWHAENRRRGRPKGKVVPHLDGVVRDLMKATEQCGGKLTFNRHNESGTLLKAIEVIRRSSPPGFIPKALSPASIERALTSYRKKKEQRGGEFLRKLLRKKGRQQA